MLFEPRHLPLRKLTCAHFDEFDGGGKIPFSAQMFGHLSVTNGLQREFVPSEALRQEAFRFLDQTAPKHLLNPRIDTGVEIGCFTGKTEEWRNGFFSGIGPIGPLGGKWLAGEPDDFNGADDPARIAPVDFGEGGRVPLFQFAEQIRQRQRFQLGAKSGVGGRRVTDAIKKGLEIKAGAAAENRQTTARTDFVNCGMRKAGKLSRVERGVDISDINQVMGEAATFGGGRFGRPDVQAAINLHRIDGNDFAAELFGEQQGDLGFAGRGGAGEQQNARRGMLGAGHPFGVRPVLAGAAAAGIKAPVRQQRFPY